MCWKSKSIQKTNYKDKSVGHDLGRKELADSKVVTENFREETISKAVSNFKRNEQDMVKIAVRGKSRKPDLKGAKDGR